MMPATLLSIKNMVCDRCIRVVREEFERLGYSILDIDLGNITIKGMITIAEISVIEEVLRTCGFALIEDDEQRSIELVKHLIISHIHHKKEKPEHVNFSDFIAQKTGTSYYTLSKKFSNLEGITIKQYMILQKIERAKELLSYKEQSLNDIAFDLGYSSTAHFSTQFKRITGVSPTAFKKGNNPPRKPLDQII